MDDETKARIADYFDPWDLVQYLNLSTAEIIQAFEDEIADVLEDVEELMEFKRG
jgi:hypothetical protein